MVEKPFYTYTGDDSVEPMHVCMTREVLGGALVGEAQERFALLHPIELSDWERERGVKQHGDVCERLSKEFPVVDRGQILRVLLAVTISLG
jgi:hypothetical protein